MRKVENEQLMFGQVNISEIKINTKSRDDIPEILLGLQDIYINPEIKKKVFSLLNEIIPENVDKTTGRPGMLLWQIFVLGALRVGLNTDYDRITELANEHKTLRQILGHGTFTAYIYKLQTLKDNISLMTPKILDQINKLVVDGGHKLLNITNLNARCDSFVGKTNVHFPTDANLLLDAVRKIIEVCRKLCGEIGDSSWRLSHFNLKQIKRSYRKVQKSKHSTSKNEEKRIKKEKSIKKAYQSYIDESAKYVSKCYKTINLLRQHNHIGKSALSELESYIVHAERQIDQIARRVLHGEKIPHQEKIFSIFEPHTEWISKGKAGVPVELGLRICVLEDQFGLILHHHVMEGQTDNEIAVSMVKEAKKRFPDLNSCSFDKGFHSPANQKTLKKLLDFPVLPKKGRCSKKELKLETSEAFIKAKNKHSAVESCINALQVHGLDICPDHGIDGYKRYIALAVVSRNIQIIGAMIKKKRNLLDSKRNRVKRMLH